MAIPKLFELGFYLKAIDGLSGTLKKIDAHMQAIDATAKRMKPLKDWGEHLAVLGGTMAGLGPATALALGETVKGFEEEQDHVASLGAAL